MTNKSVQLLRKVKTQILREPKQFVMDHFFSDAQNLSKLDIPRAIPNCGTAACIAGWVTAISLRKSPRDTQMDATFASDYAQDILGLSNNEVLRLFYVASWPRKFESRWWKAKTVEGRAKVAADRIDAFIEGQKKP